MSVYEHDDSPYSRPAMAALTVRGDIILLFARLKTFFV